jgi:hypothetical protein
MRKALQNTRSKLGFVEDFTNVGEALETFKQYIED